MLTDPLSLEQQVSEYEALLEIGVELAGTLDLCQVLETALAKAEELCSAETSSVWELDAERQELFFRVVRGRAAGEIRDLRVPLGSGIVGSVALSGQAELVNEVSADPRWRGDESSEFRTRAILAVPLAVRGRVVGVLQVLNPIGKDGFSEADLRRMTLLAGPLAHALENARLYAALKRQFLELVTSLAESVEMRDPYTGGHIRRVVGYSLLLGEDLGLSAGELEQLWLAATLHDIGKIATPDEVLRKPAELAPAEAAVMRRHTVDGAQMVSRIRGLKGIVPAVRHHHERLDGTGYPDGLKGEAIPLLPRIVAVADTFDAMTTTRPYRAGLSRDAAAAEIERGAGSQFCPRVAAAFGRLYAEGRFTLAAGQQLLDGLRRKLEIR